MGRAVRLLAALALVAACVVVPTRLAWGAPELRYANVALPPGRAVALPHPSSHLSVEWRGEHDAAVELRWRGLDGAWRPWRPVLVAHDLEDEAAGRVLSGLILADGAVAAEARVVGGEARALRVAAIDTRFGPRRLVPATPRAAGALDEDARVPQPDIVSRAEWGADETLRKGPPSHAPLTRMAVHHTVTANDDPDPKATIRAIYVQHVVHRGFDDIGYNFIVDAKGRVYEGRWSADHGNAEPTGEDADGNGVTGAHTKYNNTGTVGVALLGDFRTVRPRAEAVDALERLLAWKADRHDIDPRGTASWSSGTRSTIIGHRDAGATACPGDRLYDLLPTVRERVANIVDAANAADAVIGYWILGRDGRRYHFGAAGDPLATGLPLKPPASSMAVTPSGRGYWVLTDSGRITTFGDAVYFGSTEGVALNAPAIRIEPTPSGAGYWVLASDGGIFTFGDAAFWGSTGDIKLNAPVISMAATPTGLGYWLLAADGGVFTFGDATFWGSTGDIKLNAPVTSMAPHPSGAGYWLQATDGGIFSFGRVRFHGSLPGLGVNTRGAVQLRATPAGKGYYVVTSDGGVFTFGDARFWGSRPGLGGATAAVDQGLLPATPDGS